MFLKKLFALLFLTGCSFASHSQYWQQKVDFIIDVTLNDKEKSLDGFEKIHYENHSPDTLQFIWFHLWPNAYKNDRTAFSDQLLENGNTDFYFSNRDERGYINRLDFKVDGVTAHTEDHPTHIDIIKVLLPRPLPPGETISITTPFHVKLPFNYSRGGYDEETFQVTQWFPKPAVYDANGWHPMPYLDQGEFYSEFGNYDVRITVPANYVVASTGALQNEEEKEWLKKRKDFEWEPVVIRTSTSRSKNAPIKKTIQKFPPSSTETKTLRYLQENVHDFAWFADKRYRVHADTCRLPSGKVIEVFTYYVKPAFKLWENGFDYLKDALRFYSDEVGEYPYDVASVVHGPESFGGGMEYPTITILSPVETTEGLDRLIAHEIGHNWFQGALASNERQHPWLDEGLNSFYEYKYLDQRYGKEGRVEALWHLTQVQRKRSQPIPTSSEDFSFTNYALVAYHRTATWLQSIEQLTGTATFRSIMQEYYRQWKFKHPSPGDFLHLLRSKLDSSQQFVLDEFNQIEKVRNSGFHVVSPFKKGSFKAYLKEPEKNILLLSPAFGVNSYDKLMIGGLISNYKLPPTNFNFLFIPMYATGSKSLAGLARLNYSILSTGKIRKTDFFLNASHFSMDQFRDTANRKLTMRFIKLVPGFRLTLNNQNARQTTSKYLQWKTFLFQEQSLRITRDTTFTGTDTIPFLRYALPKSRRYLNQLDLAYENYRALYPFDVRLRIEQSADFIRPALTANYFFNYREGGLQLRFFAGGFLYLGEKTIRKQFRNDRFFLNMTGPNGYEDYTYSDYFLGRNHFEGLESQQIMMRDGGFKVRTDLLASKVGKTDRWLTAVNLNSSIPGKINPLSLLPVKIPLRVFFDLGTYADAWDKDAEGDRFLFDLGLHIPLFNESVNIYLPILYNRVYSDYYKSTITKNRFLKTISFTVNFYNKDVQQLNRELEF